MLSKFNEILHEHKDLKLNINILIIASIIITLLSEIITKHSLVNTVIWLVNNPVYFVIDWVIVLSSILFFMAITSNRIALILTSIIIIVLSIIDYFKFSIRGIPLIPRDLFLIKELSSIMKYIYNIKFIVYGCIILAMIVAIIASARFIPKIEMKLIYKILCVALTSIIFFALINIGQDVNADDGFLFSFISGINNKQNVDKILSNPMIDNELYVKQCNYAKSDKKPNIIVIMNEAFWNPNVLEGIKFNKNPTDNIEKLKENSVFGCLESPEFGGGTSNVEFELLTGYGAHFYEPGYLLYPNEMTKKPSMSLASILKKQGYSAKAIHSYDGWYYGRDKVYKNFGFDKFISKECLENTENKGFYISDDYVTDIIINELENTEEPSFIFTVTMQNHGPYNDDRYKNYEQDISVLNDINSESKQILETYSQGIYDADRALGRLIDYCEKIEEPTIVLFFGDHLPMLGENFKVYREFNFIKNNEDNKEKFKLSCVPFILWSNYKNQAKDIGVLNTSFMGSYILKYAGLDMPKYFKFLDGISKQIPVISREYAVDKDGNIIDKKNKQYIKYNELYKQYQFNIMYSDEEIEDCDKWIIHK